jgi:hypothetical protein
VLRNAKRAVARGWRQPDVEVAVENAAAEKTYVFKWAGDESNLGETMLERDGKSVPVPRYNCGDECLESETAPPVVLIEQTARPSLPVWPGPGLPPPLVANLYAPSLPPSLMIHREAPLPPRPAVLRRRRRA